MVLLAMRACLRPFGGMQAFVREGQTVLLKPNLLGAFPVERAVTTHPSVLRAAAVLAQEAGGKVIVGDSPGVGDPAKCARKAGLLDVVDELGLQFANFTDTCVVEESDNLVARRLTLAKAVEDADVIISLPKLKTHAQMTFTGALKNQFGLIVGTKKAQYHYRLQDRDWFAALILDINRAVKPSLAIMDAIIGMEGDGPAAGEPRQIGALIAGTDLAAVDTVACELICLDQNQAPLLRTAAKQQFGTTILKDIDVVGESIENMRVVDFRKVRRVYNLLQVLPLPTFMLRWIRRFWAPRPRIRDELCIKCMNCHQGCPTTPPSIDPEKSKKKQVNDTTCIRCYCCHEFCPVKAIELRRW